MEDPWVGISESIPKIIASINFTNIENWRKIIADYNRFPGTEGYYAATNFIFKKFREFVPNARLQPFEVVVPINHGANITIGEKTLKLYPMLPNWVAVSTTLGETGEIVYAGKGDLVELNNKKINGSIVVMDFNCKYNWLRVAALGAKAIIFLEPNDTSYSECAMKYVSLPVKILRFYICGNDAMQLKEILNTGVKVKGHIVSSQVWEKRTVYNILGIIEGKDTDKKNEIVAFWTYYDSFSVVPDFAFDKDSAGNPAAWLEIARYFSLNRPRRSMMFVAFSGHYQNLRGMAHFLEEYAFGNSTYGSQFAKNIKIAWGMDLSTETAAAIVTRGSRSPEGSNLYDLFPTFSYPLYRENIYKGNWELLFQKGDAINWNEGWAFKTGNVRLGKSSLLVMMNEIMKDKVGRDPPYLIGDGIDGINEYGDGFKTALVPLCITRLETSMFTVATGIVSFTLQSALTRREKWNIPLIKDTFNLTNLKPNVEFMTCILSIYANEVGISIYTGEKEVGSIFARSSFSDKLFNERFEDRYGMGFPKIIGRVTIWDDFVGNYVPVGNALVVIAGEGGGAFSDPVIVLTDNRGRFEALGFRGSTKAFEIWYTHTISAFVVNSTTGDIIYASDTGLYGQGAGPLFTGRVVLDQPVKITNQVVFRCSSLVFFDLIYPYRMENIPVKYSVNDAITHVSLLHYGIPTEYMKRVHWDLYFANILYREYTKPICLPFPIFVPPDTPVEIVSYVKATPAGIINNGGKGYVLKHGESKIIFTPVAISSDMSDLCSNRLNILNSKGIYSAERNIEAACNTLKDYNELIKNAFSNYRYDEFIFYSYRASYNALRSYESITAMFFDTAETALILLLLLLPAIYILERIVFQTQSFTKRLVILTSLSIIFTTLLYYIHPGFAITSNPYIMLLGILAIILFIPALLLLQSRLTHELKKERERLIGMHETTVDRLSALVISISYGINNMRKRAFRTALTLTSLIIFVSSLVLLTTVH
ncbi:MAG: M28 family peptidase, partial [Thermoproteota archaeon]